MEMRRKQRGEEGKRWRKDWEKKGGERRGEGRRLQGEIGEGRKREWSKGVKEKGTEKRGISCGSFMGMCVQAKTGTLQHHRVDSFTVNDQYLVSSISASSYFICVYSSPLNS